MIKEHYPFHVDPLPYSSSTLEPYIDEATINLHHDRHYQAYVDNLNGILKPHSEYHNWDLKALLTQISDLPKDIQQPVKNNGGGIVNHELYFESMGTEHPQPSDKFEAILSFAFDSMESFYSQLKAAGMTQFGSGYGYLIYEHKEGLKIINLPNQNVPDLLNTTPLLTVDVWEHAYYLKYQNRRPDYLDNWMQVIDWAVVERRYHDAAKYI